MRVLLGVSQIFMVGLLLALGCSQDQLPLGSSHDQTIATNVSSGFIQHPIRGETQITWFYDGNLVVYDGDVIYGTIDEFNQVLINITYSSSDDFDPFVARRRSRPPVLAKRSNSIFPLSPGVWPGGYIHYRYLDDPTELSYKSDVDAAITEWVRNVPCLRWVKEPNNADPRGATGVVTIRSGDDCSASVGVDGPGSLWMTLTPSCRAAAVLHEWGHVLGLIHEHKRPDALLYTTFLCNNLKDYPFGKSPATADAECCTTLKCCGSACNFNTEFGRYNLPSMYDLNSLMHYSRSAFAKPGLQTLTAGPLNNPTFLSRGDIERIKELYTCPF
ncbi:zincin [Fusarium beomiforme]|uniref:Metalloendopeptidase n=1 Tax=Fusarium beomiforme TaxID=44412 RepID=A0A9P5AAE5_9HYPO|nr:zincin [Fusarium beomiforme]